MPFMGSGGESRRQVRSPEGIVHCLEKETLSESGFALAGSRGPRVGR